MVSRAKFKCINTKNNDDKLVLKIHYQILTNEAEVLNEVISVFVKLRYNYNYLSKRDVSLTKIINRAD